MPIHPIQAYFDTWLFAAIFMKLVKCVRWHSICDSNIIGYGAAIVSKAAQNHDVKWNTQTVIKMSNQYYSCVK